MQGTGIGQQTVAGVPPFIYSWLDSADHLSSGEEASLRVESATPR